MTEVPVPVPFGSGKQARVILVTLFGDLALYPQPPIGPDRRQDIGYSLFNARSAALGLTLHGDGEVNEGVGAVASFQLMLSDDDKLALMQPFRVTLDSPDERITTVAPAVMHRQAMYEDVFRFDPLSEDHLVLSPIAPDSRHVHHRVTFTGTLAEWSFDALGFLSAFLNDLAASQGIIAPLILNAEMPQAR